ncbi:MAG: TlyA family RNA methyltransferase [Desulfamplus sp.]|nr:TlyA family RNA methyltransferase [Desulfamplus sp.]MBF0258325.1 TlyA family RNA methyltransferase [Desulfamplus sp.]
MNKSLKIRLDTLLVEKGLVQSRERARALIMAGTVLVNGLLVDKAGTKVETDAQISIKGEDIPYVSRGGLKLARALAYLQLDVNGMTCLDIGASTGGFTDCLLQAGAAKVYAVDVGYGQMDWSLRQDSRVELIERTNIRYMPYEAIGRTVDLIAVDTSFISLKIVVPSAEKFMTPDTITLALVKPQFEAGKERIGKGGVIRDQDIRQEIVKEIELFFRQRGYETGDIIESPLRGQKGNVEYIISMKYLFRQ